MKGKKGPQVFDTDEANRPDTTLETLAKLKPAFRKDGTITAGNSPGLNSGAAAAVVAERRFAEQSGLKPVARLVAYGVAAVEPGFFDVGPVPAVRQVLARARWNLGDAEREWRSTKRSPWCRSPFCASSDGPKTSSTSRGRGDCTRSSHRCDGRGVDHADTALYET